MNSAHFYLLNRFLLFSFLSFFISSCQSEKKENKEEIKTEKIENQVKKKTILFFGNSLCAGLGVEMNEAFPAVIQQKIDELALPFVVINAGLSGETTTGGNNRIDWVLRQPVDIFVLELGANDGLRGIDLAQTHKNLISIIEKVRAKNPNVQIVLAGMQLPPNMGKSYTEEFRNIFIKISKNQQVTLIPFLLDKVAGVPKLNQADGIHPTSEGHKIVAENVWQVLFPLLKSS